MTTVILGDSRLRGIDRESFFQRESIVLRVRPGSSLKSHKIQLKRDKTFWKSNTLKSCIICVGINDIPENIADLSNQGQNRLFVKITKRLARLTEKVKKYCASGKVIVATIPPKDLRRSIEKYPQHAVLAVNELTREHQKQFEIFVDRLNKFVNELNVKGTGIHMPLHVNLRIHRGRRGSKFYYDKLIDGLHPNDELKKTWFQKIQELCQTLSHA